MNAYLQFIVSSSIAFEYSFKKKKLSLNFIVNLISHSIGSKRGLAHVPPLSRLPADLEMEMGQGYSPASSHRSFDSTGSRGLIKASAVSLPSVGPVAGDGTVYDGLAYVGNTMKMSTPLSDLQNTSLLKKNSSVNLPLSKHLSLARAAVATPPLELLSHRNTSR